MIYKCHIITRHNSVISRPQDTQDNTHTSIFSRMPPSLTKHTSHHVLSILRSYTPPHFTPTRPHTAKPDHTRPYTPHPNTIRPHSQHHLAMPHLLDHIPPLNAPHLMDQTQKPLHQHITRLLTVYTELKTNERQPELNG